MTQSTTTGGFATLLEAVASKARAAGVFGEVRIERGVLRCAAKESAEPAEFRLFVEGEGERARIWVSLVTEDRWLSQSIEADLVNTGDKLEELIEEELVNLGWEGFRPTFEHFRDEKKLYTFRTPLPMVIGSGGVEKLATALLAYEAAFRPLGDMEGGEE